MGRLNLLFVIVVTLVAASEILFLDASDAVGLDEACGAVGQGLSPGELLVGIHSVAVLGKAGSRLVGEHLEVDLAPVRGVVRPNVEELLLLLGIFQLSSSLQPPSSSLTSCTTSQLREEYRGQNQYLNLPTEGSLMAQNLPNSCRQGTRYTPSGCTVVQPLSRLKNSLADFSKIGNFVLFLRSQNPLFYRGIQF